MTLPLPVRRSSPLAERSLHHQHAFHLIEGDLVAGGGAGKRGLGITRAGAAPLVEAAAIEGQEGGFLASLG